MSHNCILLKNFECRNVDSCGVAAACSKNWVKWANLGIFCYFLLGDVEKCELTTNHVMMVSKSMKTNASFYRAKL